MSSTRHFTQKHIAASLTLAFLSLLHQNATVMSFEVPFPPSPAEIRASTVLSKNSLLATSAATLPPNLPLPVTQSVQLNSGTKAEVIYCLPPKQALPTNFLSSFFGGNEQKSTQSNKPVLAFLHGSFHASWCWSEYYMPFFAGLGYPCVALSLQGTGGTPAIPEGVKKVKIASHVADLDSFLRGLSTPSKYDLGLNLGDNPQIVLIGHSFGGLTIMKWLEQYYSESTDRMDINLAGVGLLCSVPPSGNGPMTLRYLFRSLSDSWKITVGFAMKKAIVDKALCRELFFGGDSPESGISDEDLERYQAYFDRDTAATIDLGDLAGKLPSKLVDRETGNALFLRNLQQLPLKPYVLGASDDFIVDKEGVSETGRYMGLDEQDIDIVDSPHDVMLGKKWRNGANAILQWIQGI
ncbi:hypothetical protein HJC23_007850 [Cyclotella cryptica]|uniref:AB hydrolase-1 domain-containing protein n=1 Tax=Cyclotella cryptica TaxID=29204 RepID=A0ABD3R0U9_9STRA|eukprot:CCRYP_000162-RA/>CCRYP_000162-RA protein AED:0.18 eAED:0.18 QI:83/1/1/1/1/1/2/233/408